MRSSFMIATVGVFIGVVVLWNLAMVAVLRSFRIKLPFSLPFHFRERNEPELLMSTPTLAFLACCCSPPLCLRG